MNLTNYLKNLLTNLVDSYKKFLFQTMGTTLAYTIFCFIIVALLLRFSDFGPSTYQQQTSLLSYFFTNYSNDNTYSIVDLTNVVFLFFVSLFSISMIRSNIAKESAEEITPGNSFKNILKDDIFYLIIALAVCSLVDFLLFKLDNLIATDVEYKDFTRWAHNIVMYPIRSFIPWAIFSLTIYKITTWEKFQLTFKKVCFLFVAFWIIYIFSYECYVYTKIYLFGLILIPVDIERKFFFESILGIGLIAFYFVGYYAVMTSSVKLVEEAEKKG